MSDEVHGWVFDCAVENTKPLRKGFPEEIGKAKRKKNIGKGLTGPD